MTKIISTLAIFFAASAAFAAAEMQLNYFIWGSKTEGAQLGNTEGYLTDLQAKIGYAGTNYFVGAVYDQFTNELANSRPRTSYGITLGYRPQNWFFDFNYFVVSSYELTSSVTLGKGSGYSLDLGYRWSISSHFFTGLQFSWRSFSYAEAEIGNTTVSSTNKITSEYFPSLVFGLKF